jgi:hypothetical protein
MENELENKIFEFCANLMKISPLMLMRKFKLNYDAANKICRKIWLKNHIEARKLSRQIERGYHERL